MSLRGGEKSMSNSAMVDQKGRLKITRPSFPRARGLVPNSISPAKVPPQSASTRGRSGTKSRNEWSTVPTQWQQPETSCPREVFRPDCRDEQPGQGANSHRFEGQCAHEGGVIYSITRTIWKFGTMTDS